VNVLSQSLDLGSESGNPQLVLQVLQKLQRLPEPLLLEIVQKLVQVRGQAASRERRFVAERAVHAAGLTH
jgi:hypothetical protein